MKFGDVIKHKSFLDVAIRVTHVKDNNGVTEVYGYWLNQGFNDTYHMDVTGKYVSLKNIKDWLICTNPEAKCIRNEKWVELV